MGSRDTMHRARRWLPGVHVDNLPRQKHHWLVVGLIAGVLLISCGTQAATIDSRPTKAALSIVATPTRTPGLAPAVVPAETPLDVLAPADFCAEAAALGFNSMRKDVELSAYRGACPATAAPD